MKISPIEIARLGSSSAYSRAKSINAILFGLMFTPCVKELIGLTRTLYLGFSKTV